MLLIKLERNEDLTFIVIIINADWYEKKNIVIIFFLYRPVLQEIQDQDKLIKINIELSDIYDLKHFTKLF